MRKIFYYICTLLCLLTIAACGDDHEPAVKPTPPDSGEVVPVVEPDSLIVSLTEFRLPQEGGVLDFDVKTNKELKVESSVRWISQVSTRAMRTEKLKLNVAPNEEDEVRMGYITLKSGDLSQVITVTQDGSTPGASSERDILMALYEATDGPHWKHHDNWGSNLPLKEWYGVKTTGDGHLWALELDDNGLKGYLPADLCGLHTLAYLYMADNALMGGLPEHLGEMESLKVIWLVNNYLTGSIPESIGELKNLYYLALENNRLSGSIPECLGNLTQMQCIYLSKNQLEGEIPASLGNLTQLLDLWLYDNQLTGSIPETLMNLVKLQRFYINGNLMDGVIPEMLYTSDWWKKVDINLSQQEGHRLSFENLYASTDFSHDGEVVCVQRHTEGKGIPLVITGDGFSDRLIADGAFKEAYSRAVRAFFQKEPYASFRYYFDVYVVTAVSLNEMIDEDIAYKTHHQGEFYEQDSEKVRAYALKVPELGGETANVTVMVVLNERSCGRVHSDWYNDGFTIGLCTISEDMEYEVQHEVGGHGFGKLADEYWDDDDTASTFPVGSHGWLDQYHTQGWYYNADYRNDPEQVFWKRFISDAHYNAEGIGIYEGGLSQYTYGIYRPTETSIMRDSKGAYNGPSRWSIYQKIMEQGGETCTFEDFLTYDRKNLSNTRSAVERTIPRERLGAPVRIHSYSSAQLTKGRQ